MEHLRVLAELHRREYMSFVGARAAQSYVHVPLAAGVPNFFSACIIVTSRTGVARKSHIVDALCLSHLVDDADSAALGAQR